MAMFRSPWEVYFRPPKAKPNRKEGEGMHTCDICLDGWDSETEVDIHRTTAHKNQLQSLMKDTTKNVCRICVKSYKSKQDLIHHVKTWHLLSSEDAVRVEREMFICDICTVIFFNKLLLQAHILIFHTNCDKLNTFTECPKCLKMVHLKNIWYHFQGHHIQSVSCCKICLTKCTDRKEVLQHVSSEHNKYLFCDICQYQSKNANYFREHLNTRHGRKVQPGSSSVRYKPYFLPRVGDYKLKFVCDTAFKGLKISYLEELKIRICILCREICIGEQSMKDHIRNVHTVHQPQQLCHICSCGETFNNKVLLKHHIFKSKGDHTDIGLINPNEDVVYAVILVDDNLDILPQENSDATPQTSI
ncbi:zinc finger protein 639-like [Battus philenor]|uniref:zinc finger protein 639-like n=1 Tax=Battus philenor TaxID=42288 RepID=UPI0035D13270